MLEVYHSRRGRCAFVARWTGLPTTSKVN